MAMCSSSTPWTRFLPLPMKLTLPARKTTIRSRSSIVTDKREVLVYDGTVTVAEENGAYTITAILIDAAGEQHSYSYAGTLEMTTDFCGGGGEVNWKNTFDTYFTTKANGWSVYFYLPRRLFLSAAHESRGQDGSCPSILQLLFRCR